MTRIYLSSLGCRLNQSEIDSLARRLASQGHDVVGSPAEADICILNTCAVTQEAERKSRQTVRRFHRENPKSRVVLTGCYTTLSPEDTASLPGVVQVVSNSDKEDLGETLDLTTQPALNKVWKVPGGRTRAFVKIQDGCDNRCTYCVTTIARGAARSRPPTEILTEIQNLESAGYREVVLTGVHVGNYGRERQPDQPAVTLPDLVQAILSETGIQRLRLSSLEPWDLELDFFELWRNSRLCRQLHLPLQSGSATVLRRMGRHTTPAAFQRLATAALAAIPDLALTTDIIVGFPGESEDEFAASMDYVRGLDFARLHVFAFSPRPGTVAAGMADQIPRPLIQERSRQMRELASRKQETFLRSFLGRTMEVLWESPVGDDPANQLWRGLTGNYISVTAASHRSLQNTITPTLLTDLRPGGMRGRPVHDSR